jgi:adenylyltransferase/sulfurtransferase
VLGPAVGVLASLQAAMALKMLAGHAAELKPQLTLADVWNGTFRQVDLTPLLDSKACPACHQGERLWLRGTRRAASTVLCGRNAVQISPPEPLLLTLSELAERLRSLGDVMVNRFLLRLTLPAGPENADVPAEITVFPDGRAIIRGTSDPMVARNLYSRYIGG